MMNNAQLDNEKQSLRYQVDLLRDQVEDLSEQQMEIQRELKEKSRVMNGGYN
jgi:chaperonin cofactor prefoldin